MKTFREEWLARFVAHWAAAGTQCPDYALKCGEAWLDANPDDINENPEAVAADVLDEEMEQARQSL